MNYEVFTPSAHGMFHKPYYSLNKGSMKCIRNPSKEELKKFDYLPRLTLYKRPISGGFSINLRVECSLPKLMCGNNFDELKESDFANVCSRLSEMLHKMSVYVTVDTIKHASVSAIHYSKNLPLTDYTSCSMVIREIAKGSVTKLLDESKIDFRNGGTAVKFHASSHEVILYDKMSDLKNAKKSDQRSFEENNRIQLELLNKEYQKPFDVLRLEARLGNRTKIKRLFKKLEIKCELNFNELFSEKIAKVVLIDYWKMITPDVPVLASSGFSSVDLYDAIRVAEPNLKPAKLLQIVGAFALINEIGMSGLRVLVEQTCGSRTWPRIKKMLNTRKVTSNMKYNALQVAEKHLFDFEPLRLNDYRVHSTVQGLGASNE